LDGREMYLPNVVTDEPLDLLFFSGGLIDSRICESKRCFSLATCYLP
jgi:hypothetical protein